MFVRLLRQTGGYTVFHQELNLLGQTSKRCALHGELKADGATTNYKAFSEVPGPSKLELLLGVLPGGKLYKKSIYDMINFYTAKYGTFIRLPGMFGMRDLYVTMNPDDFPIIFRNEGKWPERRSFDSMRYYREVYRKEFFEGISGISLSSGEKWGKERSAANPILMQPKNVIAYLKQMLKVNDEFLERIRDIRDPVTMEMPDDFLDELLRLTLESLAAIALNTHLGLLRNGGELSEANKIITSMQRIGELAFDLDVKPSPWKIISTPKFREMMQTMDTLLNISKLHIDEALERIEKQTKNSQTESEIQEKSILEKLSAINKKFAVVMAMDMMLAGVDTTTSTLAGILLAIAKNPDKQEKLLTELKGVMPHKNSHIAADSMSKLPYLRACIKEGMRLYPIITGTLRTLPNDIVLSGYQLKKGIDISITANMLLKHEKYVPQAKKFIPERWLRTEKNSTDALSNPFMFIPFGFGPRSCIGKRIVDLELEITIARLVRNFNIEFNYPTENAFQAKFISVPTIPLKFKFEERTE